MGEVLGTSDGTPGQRFPVQNLPILPRRDGRRRSRWRPPAATGEPWVEVRGFGSSGENDPHFALDDVGGMVELGPRIRAPDGREHQYGAVPEAAAGCASRTTAAVAGGWATSARAP